MASATFSAFFHLFASIFLVAIFAGVIESKRYSDVVLFKGNKYMIIDSSTGEKTMGKITNQDYPLNETGTPDAACSVGKDAYLFKGDHFWRVTSNQRYYSAPISTLFNTTFSSDINAAMCAVQYDLDGGAAYEAAYLFKEKSVEKLRRVNGSSAMFQVVQKARLNFVPDAAVALKIISYSNPSYYPILASRSKLYLLNMDNPDQTTSFGSLARNLDLHTDEEMYFANGLAAAFGKSPSESLILGSK